MKKVFAIFLSLLLIFSLGSFYFSRGLPSVSAQTFAKANSVYFVKNVGQADKSVEYYAYLKDGIAFFGKGFFGFSTFKNGKRFVYRVYVDGKPESSMPLKTQLNYMINKSKHLHVPAFGKVFYNCGGYNLAFFSKDGKLEWNIVSKNISSVKLKYDLGKNGRLKANGNVLEITWPDGSIIEKAASSFSRGKKVSVNYKVIENNIVSFDSTAKSVLIDPATYLGGKGEDVAYTEFVTDKGIYVGGYTSSPHFPTVPGSYDENYSGNQDGFVSLFSSDLSTLIASTFIGGSGEDGVNKITVSNGTVYVTGYTKSTSQSFPVTPDAYQTDNKGGEDVFVAELNDDLSQLKYATYLGGTANDRPTSIAVYDNSVYVAGSTYSADFPTTDGAYDRTSEAVNTDQYKLDGFISRLSGDLSTLEASTFLEGSSYDIIYALGIHNNSVYVTGYTYSSNFPVVNAYQSSNKGAFDAFVSKLDLGLTQLESSTYLGGSNYDFAYDLAFGTNGVYVAGGTFSSNFPVTFNALQKTYGGASSSWSYGGDGFISELSFDLSTLKNSTYLGGEADDSVSAIKIAGDKVFVAGNTKSDHFPINGNTFDESYNGGGDGFIARISNDLSDLELSTYFGGTNQDNSGALFVYGSYVYVTGSTYSTDFPITNGAYDTDYNGGVDTPNSWGGGDAFVLKLTDLLTEPKPILKIRKTDSPDPVQAGDNITYQITISNTGNMNAHNVVITDTVPANTTFVSASFVSGATGTITDPGAGNTGDVQWTLNGTLDVGDSAVVQLVVKTNSPLPNGTTINNTASVRSDEVSPVSDSETTTISSTPKLKIKKTGPKNAAPGSIAVYTITIKNTGNGSAYNTVLTDYLPAGEHFISGTPAPDSVIVNAYGTKVVWNVGNFDPDKTLIFTYRVTVPLVMSGCMSFTNKAILTADNADKVETSFRTLVCAANPQPKPNPPKPNPINITINPPEKICINSESKFVFTFTGGVPPYNYKIGFGDGTDVVTGKVSGKFTTLMHTFAKEGVYTIKIDITDSKGTKSTLTKTIKVNKYCFSPAIDIKKIITSKSPYHPGSTVSYKIVVTNTGDVGLNPVILTDKLPLGVTFSSANPSPTKTNSNVLIWNSIGPINPGKSKAIYISVTINSNIIGQLCNEALVKATYGPDKDDYIESTANVCILVTSPPQPKPKPEKPNPINITINPPEKICINSESKFVFTFTGGVPPYIYKISFGDGTDEITGKENGKFITLLHTYTKVGLYTVSIDVTDSKGTSSVLTRSVDAKDCRVVLLVYHQNFIIGYPDGTFRPEKMVTRAEVATMLSRALGFNANVINHISPFKDVSAGKWYFRFVKTINAEKLMKGRSQYDFYPNVPATRAEIAAILVRIRGLKPEEPQEQLFTDVKPTDWFNGYIYTAVKAGLLQGYKDHTFRPNKPVTRAEFVTLLSRALYREDVPQAENLKNLPKLSFTDVSAGYWAYRYIIEAAVPHIVTNALRAPINLTLPTKTIPVYLASTKSEIRFPKIGTSETAIVPVDGLQDGKDPAPRKVIVRIINTGTP